MTLLEYNTVLYLLYSTLEYNRVNKIQVAFSFSARFTEIFHHNNDYNLQLNEENCTCAEKYDIDIYQCLVEQNGELVCLLVL